MSRNQMLVGGALGLVSIAVAATALMDPDGFVHAWLEPAPHPRELLLLAITAWVTLAAYLVLNGRTQHRIQLQDLRSDLLARLCHEFRTPLTAIRGYAELLHEESPSMAEREDLQRILIATASLTRLVGDVLDLEQLSADGPLSDDDISIADVIDRAVERCRYEGLRRPVQIRLSGETDLVADRRRLIRVIANLLLSCDTTPQPTPILIAVRSYRGGIEVQMHDGSDGLTATELAALSLPMPPGRVYAANRPGLSLSVAAGHLRAMGGDLTVKSGDGDGALGFTLPTRRTLTWSPEASLRESAPPAR